MQVARRPWVVQPRPWRRRLSSAPLLAAAAVLASIVALSRGLSALAPMDPRKGVAKDVPHARPASAITEFLDRLDLMLHPFQQQVQAGQVIHKFGEKAQGVTIALAHDADSAFPEIERIIDGQLELLFLKQLALLRRQIVSKYRTASHPLEAVSQADVQFVEQAQELVRAGSRWSYEPERYAVRAALEGAFRREGALVEEKAKSARVQQTTVEVINKLQTQMEVLQQKVQNLRAGSPWFLSASYRIPRTPFQVIGRYQQGHGSLELSLSPDKDPANAEAGFVQGVGGPANVGVSVNLGG